jgi:hypothetical protein
MVLKGKEFAVNKSYAADDQILKILKILKALRSILLIQLGISEEELT